MDRLQHGPSNKRPAGVKIRAILPRQTQRPNETIPCPPCGRSTPADCPYVPRPNVRVPRVDRLPHGSSNKGRPAGVKIRATLPRQTQRPNETIPCPPCGRSTPADCPYVPRPNVKAPRVDRLPHGPSNKGRPLPAMWAVHPRGLLLPSPPPRPLKFYKAGLSFYPVQTNQLCTMICTLQNNTGIRASQQGIARITTQKRLDGRLTGGDWLAFSIGIFLPAPPRFPVQ